MNDEWVVWLHKIEPDSMEFFKFEGFDKPYLLKDGVSLLDQWPDDVRYTADPEHPDNTVLIDCPFNTYSHIIVSERLRQFLSASALEAVEYLPVHMYDHKQRQVDDQYFIVNCKQHVDCLDLNSSKAEQSMMTDDIVGVDGIVLKDTEKLDGLKLFRLTGFGIPTLVSRVFADEMLDKGYSGVRFGSLAVFKDKTW